MEIQRCTFLYYSRSLWIFSTLLHNEFICIQNKAQESLKFQIIILNLKFPNIFLLHRDSLRRRLLEQMKYCSLLRLPHQNYVNLALRFLQVLPDNPKKNTSGKSYLFIFLYFERRWKYRHYFMHILVINFNRKKQKVRDFVKSIVDVSLFCW